MLTAAERLRRSNLFQRTYSAKKSVSCPLFTLYVLPRQPRSAAKLPLAGFVVAKKVHNKASVRNRIKRQVREAYRLLRSGQPVLPQEKPRSAEELNLGQWYTLVWLIHDKALTATWQEIYYNVADCMKRASEKHGRRTAEKSN